MVEKTFDIFESYWPKHSDEWPSVNEVTKYVVSNTKASSSWENTVFLDNIERIKKLKGGDGIDLQVHGSGQLIQSLLAEDLVDELWLKIFPITLGQGKKLFVDGTKPAAFTLLGSTTTPAGVIFANYKRSGEVKTGAIGE